MTRKNSVHVEYRCSYHRPNYIVHVSNTIIFLSNIVDCQLVEPVNAEPTDKVGQLYFLRQKHIKVTWCEFAGH